MGLFDFIKPKKRTRSAPARGRKQPMARAMHYAFAHRTLRDFSQRTPVKFLTIVEASRTEKFLEKLINQTKSPTQTSSAPELTPGDMSVHRAMVRDLPCAIVQFPTPTAATEAYFVATVLLVPPRAINPRSPQPPSRYFVLERGSSKGKTVLSEWQGKVHCNLGAGPSPTVENFVSAIEAVIFSDQ